MSHKLDERKDGIQKIKKDIENTQHNIEFTNGLIDSVSDTTIKRELQAKNENRLEEIESMIDNVKNRIKD